MKDIENCPFQPRQVGDERPTFGKRMIVEKVRQVETRVKYRWLRRGMLQQVLLNQGREVIRPYHRQRGRKILTEAVEQSVEVRVGVDVDPFGRAQSLVAVYQRLKHS